MSQRSTHTTAIRVGLAIVIVLSLATGGVAGSIPVDESESPTAADVKPTGTLSPVGLVLRPLDEHTCVDSSQWDLGIDDCMS
jgi:hypothetical protein